MTRALIALEVGCHGSKIYKELNAIQAKEVSTKASTDTCQLKKEK